MIFQKSITTLTVILFFSSLSAQEPIFKFLKTGEVMPEGWLKNQMQQDIENGYARHIPQLTDRCHLDVYDVSNRDSIKTGSGGLKGHIWWDGESTGNWLDGFIRMAFLSGNKQAIKEAGKMVKTILGYQEKDGYLGTYPKSMRYESPLGIVSKNPGEPWNQACLFRGLIGYYELTGKKQVLEAVEKATLLTISMYNKNRPIWSTLYLGESGPGHSMMFVDVCEQLYRITGKQQYLDFIQFMYDSFNDLGDKTNADADQLLRNLANLDLPLKMHGAHVIEHIRAPYALYYTGDEKYAVAYKNWFKKVEKHLTPSGACISDEAIRGRLGSPDIGAEYCTMFELLFSLQSAIEKTANPQYGDMIEKLAFNTAQGARMKNGLGIQYLTKDNQTEASSAQKHGSRFMLSPTHEQAAVCCVPNSIRFYSYYVSNMWMRTKNENSIAAITYGPSVLNTVVKGVEVEVIEETTYPFEENVKFTINPKESLEFPILFREPLWAKNTKIDADGARVERQNGFIRITKRWEKGDQVKLTFGAEVVKNYTNQKQIYFSRGPLVYSLGFNAEFTKTRTYPVEGFYDMDAEPVKGQSLNYSYTKQSDFTIKKNGGDPENSWINCNIKLNGLLFNVDKAIIEKVDLVPLGSTLLRQTTFPVK